MTSIITNCIVFFLGIMALSSCTAFHLTPSKKIQTLEFSNDPENEYYKFLYQNNENSPDLRVLRKQYRLDSIADTANSEFEMILFLLEWTKSRWAHNGANQPSKSNTLTILKEAGEGRNFRCVEYGIVLRTVLASFDLKARTLGLKTKDVETVKFGAGHVITEVWSAQHNKWFMLDPQFNIVPILDGVPLNAVEFQSAIALRKDIKLMDRNGRIESSREKQYLGFIPPYLFYFNVGFDQRELDESDLLKINGNSELMLVPLGAKKPTVFQRRWQMNYFEYTNSLSDFYKNP